MEVDYSSIDRVYYKKALAVGVAVVVVELLLFVEVEEEEEEVDFEELIEECVFLDDYNYLELV